MSPSAAINHPYFHSESQKCLTNVQPHPIFIWSFIEMVFFGVIFSPVVQIFALLVHFGANFLLDRCALRDAQVDGRFLVLHVVDFFNENELI